VSIWLVGAAWLVRAAMGKLTKAHRRWLKRLATGRIPDKEWPIGFDARTGQIRTEMPVLKVVPDAPDDRGRPHFRPNQIP
jgi:hypothetical protein